MRLSGPILDKIKVDFSKDTDFSVYPFNVSVIKNLEDVSFTVANFFDDMSKIPLVGMSAYTGYGGKSLHEQSHGESFLSFFNNRLGEGGFYIFDEPEAALSPQRQLALLKIINDLCKNPETQFIIATHSPILLEYPGAVIYSCDGDSLDKITYEETLHYEITKGFLNHSEQY